MSRIYQISSRSQQVLLRKVNLISMNLYKLLFYILAVPIVLCIRLIKPWFLVRFGALTSSRIGHFAANTELFLCERDAGINVPKQRYADLFFMDKVICNNQLATMWRRVLNIYPTSILGPALRINRWIPGWRSHEIGHNTQIDRDVHDLYRRFPPHLMFTDIEIQKGEDRLREMGIPKGAAFVCLIVRDDAYLKELFPTRDYHYHDYRNGNINNFVLVAETLAERGYFVLRMGAKVEFPLNSSSHK